jgi:hypothetical protein
MKLFRPSRSGQRQGIEEILCRNSTEPPKCISVRVACFFDNDAQVTQCEVKSLLRAAPAENLSKNPRFGSGPLLMGCRLSLAFVRNGCHPGALIYGWM